MMHKYISKICHIPLEFLRSNKSAFQLAQESGFGNEYTHVNIDEIENFLKHHRTLIDAWKQWSMDKRTKGGYFMNLDDQQTIGKIDENGIIEFTRNFQSPFEACAMYIYLEVSSILGLSEIIGENKGKN